MHKVDGFSAKPLGKKLFHCQNDCSSHGPADQFRLLESAQNSLLWRADSKSCRLVCRVHRIRVDGSRIRKEKAADSKISGYVWTWPKQHLAITVFIYSRLTLQVGIISDAFQLSCFWSEFEFKGKFTNSKIITIETKRSLKIALPPLRSFCECE